MEDQWIKLISQVGFPIAITCYVMIRIEKAIKEMTTQIYRLTMTLARHGITVDEE